MEQQLPSATILKAKPRDAFASREDNPRDAFASRKDKPRDAFASRKAQKRDWLVPGENAQEYLPGPSLFRFATFFRIGLMLFWALSAMFLLSSCTARALSDQLASHYFPSQDAVDQIIRENTALSSADELPEIKVRELWSGQKEQLVWVDFNSPKLCGQAGCAYSLYLLERDTTKLKRVWWGYLNPRLPPKVSLLSVQPLDQKGQIYPCFAVNQLESPTAEVLRQITLCWEGSRYQAQSDRLISRDKKGVKP